MESIFQDVRLALRTWLKRPGFNSLVVLTLALGIGANAAVFSVIDGVLLRPLPYEDQEKLTLLRTELVETGDIAAKSSPPEVADFRAVDGVFDSAGAIWARPAALTDDRSEPEEIEMGFVTAGFLSIFGVDPFLGRDVLPEEDVPNAPAVVVLSHGLWERRYGADPDIVGKTLEMDGEPLTIVGVMPSGFALHLPPDAGVPPYLEAWVPWGGGYEESPRSFRVLTAVGRLRDAIGLDEARARISTLALRLAADHPEDYEASGLNLHLAPLPQALTAPIRPALVVLWTTVGFVLFIACANVANLFLVRATSTHEVLVRRALGASRSRLLRQIVIESVLLSLAGGLAGALLAEWAVSLLPWLSPGDIPRLTEIAVDGRVLAFLLAASLISGIGIGLVSALHLSRPDSSLALRSRGTGESGQNRLRRVLVAGEIALSLVLLAGGGLLLRSFHALSTIELGYETERVATFKLSLIDSAYPYSGPLKIARFYRELISRIEEIAGVEAAGASTELPLDGAPTGLRPYAYESDRGLVEWDTVSADYRTVTPGWLEALDVRLLEGRLLEWTDDLDHPNVVVVDELLAKAAWPGESAAGKRLQVVTFVGGEFRRTWSEVVGVVAHVRHHPGALGEEQIFLPHSQSPQRTMTFAIRSELPLKTLSGAIRDRVRILEPSQPIHSIRPMDDYRASALATHRFTMGTMGSFALVALALASLGVYGVMG
ncbi:MAG TPA: ADOP family duplicated permease, partial [Vicinamibacteria bacterium]|nr:ADOP family duplicated permease [Vicinamibacteria bacterium]